MYAALRKLAPVFVFLLSASVVMGQVATGTYPYGTFDSPGLDTINVGNLNVHLSIPVLNKAGRGLTFYYNLSFDSSVWYPATTSGSQSWVPAQSFGWSGQTDGPLGYVTYGIMTAQCQGDSGRETYQFRSNYVYVDSFGRTHTFPLSILIGADPQGCSGLNRSGTATALDGSGYSVTASSASTTITTKSGSTITPPIPGTQASGSIVDTNGNEITLNGSGTFEDTTGKTALTVSGAAPNPLTLTYTDTNGNSQTVTMTYQTYTVQTAFGCSGIGEYGPLSTSLVNTITFPDGSTYTFSYEATPGVPANVTGRLASVELPQGGTIQYTYSGGNNGIECADGSAAGLTRTLSANAGSAASTWSYTRSITGTGTSQTNVVDGLGNSKVYNFVEAGNQPSGTTAEYYETRRSIYQGSTSGPLILARNTCYNAESNPCSTTIFTLPITQIDTYETLNGLETHGGTTKYNAYGAVTETDVYDYASGSSRGPLLRREDWTYGYSIPVLPTVDDVYDGSGNLAGETKYSYDQTTPTASSGVPQHVAVSGPRGNLTSETVYASSGTSYSLSATYEDTGSLLTSATPTGTTTLTYDPTFVYTTGTALPTPSSGVAIGLGATYDTTNTGLPLTSTDPNTQVTTMATYDSMLRPTEVEYPDGGEAALFYSPTQLGQHTFQTSSIYSDTETQYDGYGRQSRVAVNNGQGTNPWYQNDTCYDANGNVSFVSYPYQGTGWGTSKVCSGSGDAYTYDVLGRLTNVTRANGETRNYSYSGRATESTDENGVQRISQVDGLGRKTIVCEISSNGSMPGSGSPVSCGTDITGTGFTTTYSYALATGATTVTQGAQTRIFQTDWLGRTILVTEPESGTTTYSYAYNSTGLVVTRTRPKANQTNSSVTTTTTTQYDSLNRVISVSYSDGTGTKNFAYDSSTGWSSFPQSNLKGRLATALMAGTTYGATTGYTYDAMGRITGLGECTPSTCGVGGYNLAYTYDLAGNLKTSTDGGGVTSTYTVSPANELSSLTSSVNNSTNPSGIISNVQNGPNGPISYSLGNGLSSVSLYDTLGRTEGGWVCSGSVSVGCSGGSQSYGFSLWWTGVRMNGESDTVLNVGVSNGYDEFNRLTSRTVNSGTTQNFTYVYDRYDNRWQQNALQTGPSPQLSFNTATNQINTSGYAYDAAGNMTNDGFHTYTYDGEGNIVSVDSGSTAQYSYNALNQRVQTVVGSTKTEFVYNANGQRVSIWNGSTNTQLRGQYYWGTKPVAFYANGAAHFQHQDWLGTERLRTTYNGAMEGSFTSLPFGDAQTVASGTDLDPYHFAQLDYDSETITGHAQFRQYNGTQGRWMRPDPYYGSYRLGNPQSFNRYAYVLNNPLAMVDPLGLDVICYDTPDTDNPDGSYGVTGGTTVCFDDGSGGGGGDSGGGGGGPSAKAPSNATPWYKSCTAKALGSGALSIGVDALGFIPGEKDVQAAVEIGSGTVARQIGNWNGYRGIVADQFGARFIAGQSQNVSAAASGYSIGNGAGTGDWLGTGLAVAGLIPGLNEVAAVASIGYDAYKTVKAVASCP